MEMGKKFVLFIAIMLTIFSASLSVQAAAAPKELTVTAIAALDTTITPRKDVIVMKKRVFNGKQQYRRWNETRKVWVDPYWIDL